MMELLTHAIAFFAGFFFATWMAFTKLDAVGRILNHVPKG